MRVVKEHFTSIHQMLEVTEKRPNNKVMQGEDSSHSGDYDFTMTKSWKEAINLFQYGYTDILEEIKAGMDKETKFQTPAARRKMKTAVQGFVPHVPNAVLGLPNSMINIESEVKKTKAISIVYSITANCNINAKEFVKSGIAVLSTIHALELKGIRVNLKIMFYNAKHGNERAFGTVDLKQYREHLDLQKLCFPVAHPSMFRRIGFKWLETFPELKENGWSWGYGSQMLPIEVLDIKGLLADNEYYLSLEITKKCQYSVDKIIERMNVNYPPLKS